MPTEHETHRTPGARHDRMLCGLRVASELPLPDLAPWTGADRPADLTIALGPVPARLNDVTVDRPLLQATADGTCRFAVPGVAAYLISPDGDRVVVDPVLDPAAPDIRVFLLGTVFGILCFKRGWLPLHAGCVRVGAKAVAFAGPSGVGKSTLAAAFLRRGHAVLADDVTVLDISAPGGPQVLPAFPRLKLWRDAMQRMDFPTDGLERARVTLEKYHVPIDAAFCTDPLPLSAVFYLHLTTDRRHGILRRLRGPEAAARIAQDIYRNALMVRLGLSSRLLPAAAATAGAPNGIWTLPHVHDAAGQEESIDRILQRAGP